jgi:hypothetical protein
LGRAYQTDGIRGLAREPGHLGDEETSFSRQQALRRRLERQLRQPVDVLINPGRTTAFMRQAWAEGRRP